MEEEAYSSSCKSKSQKGLNVSNKDGDDKMQRVREKGVNQSRSLSEEKTCAKINEIFGDDEIVAVDRLKKKHKKYRSLKSIYSATMPITTILEVHKTTIINKNLM